MLESGGITEIDRLQNVNELISNAVEYSNNSESPTLRGFLEEVALISDIDKYDEDADAVALMTIHSAKGLEFPVVFLPGMEENLFPGSQVRTDPAELSEERRLAYVAITRAKEKIYISHTRERMMYGRTSINPLSRFVREELPEHLLEEEVVRRPQRPAPTYAPRRPQGPALSGEFLRKPTAAQQSVPARPSRTETFAPGARVRHDLFGTGTILSVRPMGGDTLYEVKFDNGQVKKLMATYAKLSRA